MSYQHTWIDGSAIDLPAGKVVCVGRNYADHAAEMGHEVDREAPFYFTKSAHAVLLSGNDMPYPPRTADLHHEMELIVALGKGGTDIAEAGMMEIMGERSHEMAGQITADAIQGHLGLRAVPDAPSQGTGT